MEIPFLSFDKRNHDVREETMATFELFFDSKWYVLGNGVKEFEEKYADFNQTRYAIGVSNGLDALHLALVALNIKEGDEVIVPSNTFIATLLAISYVGATPVLVEPDQETYNIDVEKIEQAITKNTKVIIPVHLYGQACEMDKIVKIAQRYNLFIVEDNAQSQGASWQSELTGSIGDINATSFYPGKNLGALGDAGAITTDNVELANKINTLRNYGSSKKYVNNEIGFNHRLDEIQARFLSVFIKYLPKWTEERQNIANWYNNYLKDIPQVQIPKIAEGATHVYHLYVILIEERDELQEFLKKNGVQTLIHYPIPPHLQECYINLGYKKGDFPIAEKLANTCLSLPIYPGLTQNKVEDISMLIKEYFK